VAEIGDVQGVGLWRPGAPVPASVMLVDALAKGRYRRAALCGPLRSWETAARSRTT
jgi:hypothetical protein